jgi:hypothetical protein
MESEGLVDTAVGAALASSIGVPKGGEMNRPEIERRLERIERLLQAASEETRHTRLTLGTDIDTSDRWARKMLAVLEDLDHRGGEVPRRAFLEIGESHGYNHRGMASYYQVLVERAPRGRTRLTAAGRERLRLLRERYATPGS